MNAFLVDAVRTARGGGKAKGGALSKLHPQEILGQALAALLERTGSEAAEIDDVIIGCVSQANEQGANIARNAVLALGWPYEVTGVSLNRACGSSSQAIHYAAMSVACGAQKAIIAGGVESMSRTPMGSDGGGIDGNNPKLRRRIFQVPQGISADLIATLEMFDRCEVDGYALRSHQRAVDAIRENRFESLIPVKDPDTGEVLLSIDQPARPGTTMDALRRLRPAFEVLGGVRVGPGGETFDELALQRYPEAKRINHVHTAGNSSALADGAAVALVCGEDFVRAHGLRPRARVRAMATAGTEPVLMLTAPVPAAIKALRCAGMQPDDVDVWEINEAFAAVTMKAIRDLNLDRSKVNVNGGAIALGHPLGATGAILMSQLIDELERADRTTGLVTLCIGGGQGIATVVERT